MELSDIAALTSCTRLTTTPAGAFRAITARTTLGLKIDATTNTGGWKYETPAVKRMAMSVMKLKNGLSEVQTTALRVFNEVRR